MEEQNIRRQAALMVHASNEGAEPTNRVQLGVNRASEILADERGLDPHGGEGAQQLARAVSSMLAHREAGGLDFSETSLDVTRTVLAAWSLDRMREEAMGNVTIDDDDRYVRDVASGYGDLYPEVESTGLVDQFSYGMTLDAVLGAASIPTEMRDSHAIWELAAMEKPSDDRLGLPAFPVSIAPTKGEQDDIVLDSMNDAAVVRQGAAILNSPVRNGSFGTSGYSSAIEGRIAGAEARRSFPGELDPVQKGLLASEEWLARGLGRGMRDYEMRMGDQAVGRALEQHRSSPLEPVEAARIILLDTAIQMSAHRTVEAQEYGLRSTSPRQAYDDVIAASAGFDLHASSIAPDEVSSLATSMGNFHSIPNRDIAMSISTGLAEARDGYSPAIDRELASLIRTGDSMRNREMAAIELGEAAFQVPRGLSKGPDSGMSVLGSHVVGREGGRD